MKYNVQTPIVIIIFNRLDFAKILLQKLKEVKPKKLYVVADGPRGNKLGEDQKCLEVREYISNFVNWDCELIKVFSERNLGCKERISSGISEAFKSEKRLIILEDDCIPSNSFFRYCDELLEKYDHNSNIKMISGSNLLEDHLNKTHYFFSRHASIWGWATWSRAWDPKEINLKSAHRNLNAVKNMTLLEKFFWEDKLFAIKNKKLNTWDYLWDLNRMKDGGLSVVPSKNMITNIGFGTDSTHTSDASSPYSNLKAHECDFPLLPPSDFIENRAHQKKYLEVLILGTLTNRFKLVMKYLLRCIGALI